MMEQILERENLSRAWQRVKSNAGACGVDGMSIEAFPAFSREHWPRISSALMDGTYRPAPVRRVFTPKPDGSQRPLARAIQPLRVTGMTSTVAPTLRTPRKPAGKQLAGTSQMTYFQANKSTEPSRLMGGKDKTRRLGAFAKTSRLHNGEGHREKNGYRLPHTHGVRLHPPRG